VLNFVRDAAAGCAQIAIIIAVCVAIEYISPIERLSLRDRLPGFAMNMVQVPLMIVAAWPIYSMWHSLGVGRIATIPLSQWLAPLGAAGFAIQVLVLLLVSDFLAYWRHRVEHKVFWRIHMIHHAPTEVHAANTLGHPLQMWYTILFIGIPMALIHIDGPAVPATVTFIVVLLTYYIHSTASVHFGPLRKILVDNRFHRIHHSTEERHFDKNFGICFSIWDRMFGTACDPVGAEWPDVGLANVDPPRTIADYLLMPFRLTKSEIRHRAQAGAQSRDLAQISSERSSLAG
jgi:sterol desaturase/sphingolipid hydroxylase (fatty acid hydroxylase superfamily)